MSGLVKKWWFWVGLILIIGIAANKNGGSSSSESNSSDSLDMKNIKNSHVLFTHEDFDFIESEGIYGLSSMWSTDNPVANKIAKAKSEGSDVAFKGKLDDVLPHIRYNYEFTNRNTGCTKNHWVDVIFDITEEQEKILGWEFRKISDKEFVVTGKIIKQEVNPAESACDNGVVKLTLELDKIYDFKTKRVLID
jgi:hypothetical protein